MTAARLSFVGVECWATVSTRDSIRNRESQYKETRQDLEPLKEQIEPFRKRADRSAEWLQRAVLKDRSPKTDRGMKRVLKLRGGDLDGGSLPPAAACLWRKFRTLRCARPTSQNLLAIFVGVVLSLVPACSKQAPLESVTLTFLDVEWDTPDRLPQLARDLQDFSNETGILVRRLPRPDGSLDQLALWRQQLGKGAAGPDLVSIDVIWSGMLSQYLLDLKAEFAVELSSQDPVVLSSYTVDDKVVAMPHHNYVGVLLYRPDLLRMYGYHKPPSTWDELETMSRKIQSGERARGAKDFWGYVWPGGLDEDLTCSGLEWQVSDGAGRIIEKDKTISVNNPRTVRTWERASQWIGSISPPGVVAYSKWDAQNVWGSGRAVFLRGWASNYSMTTGGWPFPQKGLHTVPDHVRQFGITSMPGGRVGRISALGGNGLAVSQSSAHPREAMQLIRFLLRKDQELIRNSTHFEVPTEVTFYQLPITLNPYPKLAGANQHGGVIAARPSVVARGEYENVTRAYIQALHSVLTRKKVASVAAAELERNLISITGFTKGQPSK